MLPSQQIQTEAGDIAEFLWASNPDLEWQSASMTRKQ
jgi:hypothetical protein